MAAATASASGIETTGLVPRIQRTSIAASVAGAEEVDGLEAGLVGERRERPRTA